MIKYFYCRKRRKNSKLNYTNNLNKLIQPLSRDYYNKNIINNKLILLIKKKLKLFNLDKIVLKELRNKNTASSKLLNNRKQFNGTLIWCNNSSQTLCSCQTNMSDWEGNLTYNNNNIITLRLVYKTQSNNYLIFHIMKNMLVIWWTNLKLWQ